MTTTELARELRKWAEALPMAGVSPLWTQAADRLIEQERQLERMKEIVVADQTDYLIVGELRQLLSNP
jgi:hypothetical protein